MIDVSFISKSWEDLSPNTVSIIQFPAKNIGSNWVAAFLASSIAASLFSSNSFNLYLLWASRAWRACYSYASLILASSIDFCLLLYIYCKAFCLYSSKAASFYWSWLSDWIAASIAATRFSYNLAKIAALSSSICLIFSSEASLVSYSNYFNLACLFWSSSILFLSCSYFKVKELWTSKTKFMEAKNVSFSSKNCRFVPKIT